MTTLNQFLDAITELLKKYPDCGNLPLIYASDDEGNDFKKVISIPILAKVEDLSEHYLDIQGFEGDDDVNPEEFNAICIN